MWLLFIYINSLLLQSDTITCTNHFFDVSPLGNIYAVDGSQIKKINLQGKVLYTHSSNSFGNIFSVDISNPMQLLVYYRDFNQLVYLDRQLSPIGSAIDLYEYSNSDNNLVCASQKGGFWIYNNTDNQAIRVNTNGSITTKSMLLSGFFGSTAIQRIAEFNNQLYLLYPRKGIVILNQEGQFLQKLTLPDIQTMQYQNNRLYFTNVDCELFTYDFATVSSQKIWKGNSTIQQIKVAGNKIYYSDGKTITAEKIPENK